MDMQEKTSNKSLTSAYDKEEIGRYDDYEQDDVPMSAEEKALVRKIDLYILPIICMIDFFQVIFSILNEWKKKKQLLIF